MEDGAADRSYNFDIPTDTPLAGHWKGPQFLKAAAGEVADSEGHGTASKPARADEETIRTYIQN